MFVDLASLYLSLTLSVFLYLFLCLCVCECVSETLSLSLCVAVSFPPALSLRIAGFFLSARSCTFVPLRIGEVSKMDETGQDLADSRTANCPNLVSSFDEDAFLRRKVVNARGC